jgi:hypothetical protein
MKTDTPLGPIKRLLTSKSHQKLPRSAKDFNFSQMGWTIDSVEGIPEQF